MPARSGAPAVTLAPALARLRERAAALAPTSASEWEPRRQRPGPTGPCPACGHRSVWLPAAEPVGWRCSRCEPCEAAANPGAVFDYRMPAPDGDPTRCRHCGEAMGWPRPVGLVFADGTAAHHACDERAEAERLKRRTASTASPDVAEVTVLGGYP